MIIKNLNKTLRNMKYFLVFILSILFLLENINIAKANEPLNQADAKVFNSAHIEHKNGNHAKVIEMLQKYINAEKTHSFAYTLYGLSSTELSKYKQAITAYDKGLKHYPTNYNLRHNLALTLMQDKQHNRAANEFVRLIGTAPSNQRNSMRYLAAQNYFSAKNYSRAAEVGKPLADVKNPDKAHLRFVAISYLSANSWANANKYFTLLVTLYPDDPQAWNALAQARLRQNNNTGAASALELSNRINPQSSTKASNNGNLAGIYANMHAPRLEILALNTLSRTQGRKAQYLQALIKAGNFQKTFNYIDQELKANPSASLYFIKGFLECRLLRREDAKKTFLAGSQSAGAESEQCLFFLALLHWEDGERKSATEIFEKLTHSSKYGTQASQAIKSIELIEKEALFAELLIDVDE